MQKDSFTHMHGLTVHTFISRKLWALFMFLTGFNPFIVSLLFPLSITFFFTWLLMLFHLTYMRFFSINPSANVFVFGDFNIHHKDWLTYSSGTDRFGEPCYNFSISNDLSQMVNFPTWIPDCNPHSPAIVDFFLSEASICSAMAFLPLENSDHVVVSVSIDFPSNS